MKVIDWLIRTLRLKTYWSRNTLGRFFKDLEWLAKRSTRTYNYTIDDLAAHAQDLADSHGVVIQFEASANVFRGIDNEGMLRDYGFIGLAASNNKVVFHPPQIKNVISYIGLLHELGHLCSHDQQPYDDRLVYDLANLSLQEQQYLRASRRHNEVDAWRWAFDHALVTTPEMARLALFALKSYGVKSRADVT